MSRHDRLDHVIGFRKLSPEEEREFRQYARDHHAEAAERLASDSLCVIHPVVRDEWRKMGLVPRTEDEG